jgi:hypothetical protein
MVIVNTQFPEFDAKNDELRSYFSTIPVLIAPFAKIRYKMTSENAPLGALFDSRSYAGWPEVGEK